MKKLYLLSCLFAALSLHAQEAKTVFINMPDSICPLLTAVNRADCIDFLESQMKAEVTNRLNQKSEMTRLTANDIHINLTPTSTWQLRLLATSDSTSVISVITTACAPACDSRIRFYTDQWKELPAGQFITPPVLNDFLTLPADTADYALRDAVRQADMLLLKASFDTDTPALTFTLSTPDYMNKEAADTLLPHVRQAIVYQWQQDNRRFVPAGTPFVLR
ncbi:MAG: DUF3256 family protein [Prevotellaceae bacterium]|jgi:hypothetical protein|nr:DUF3256 family protein [Prevotellaceae bacterium]